MTRVLGPTQLWRDGRCPVSGTASTAGPLDTQTVLAGGGGYSRSTIRPALMMTVVANGSQSCGASITALVRIKSAGPEASVCTLGPRRIVFLGAVGLERMPIKIPTRMATAANINAEGRIILLLQTGEQNGGEEEALQSQFPAGGVVPFVESVRAAGFAAAADGNGGDAERERNVGVGGAAFKARTGAEKAIDATDRIEQRRIVGKLAGGAQAEGAKSDLQRCAGVTRGRSHFFFCSGLHG